MKKIQFEKAKNGGLTCSADGKFLHSKYNPQKEAETFAANLQIQNNPEYIVITEPCISYSAVAIKEKFKSAKIAAIRFSHEFDQFNQEFSFVVYVSENETPQEICSELIKKIGEKNILKTAFLQWIPAANAFPEQNAKTWAGIKSAAEYARAILATNSCFSKRWFLNSIKNLAFAKEIFALQKTNLPVVIAASGRSLENSLEKLKKFRSSFFLIGVSSAVSALLRQKIIPDFVISTDGGFWAKKHLEILKNFPEIPVALALESACPSFILKRNPIILLEYNDGFSKKMADFLNLTFPEAERNGTVSGTAVSLALKLTEKNIYVCGLDLHSAKGFQHSMPNSLEIFNARKDNKISGNEIRAAKSEFSSDALKIYENWFSDSKRNFQGRVFRLSENFPFKNNLNSVKDVNFDFFYKNEKISLENEKTENAKKMQKISVGKNIFPEIRKFKAENSKTEEWLEEFFPAEMFALKNKTSTEEKQSLFSEICAKNKKFIEKIEKLLK